ncbi:methylmalonyl Co-A mutase-associated GTPase MeaB [Rhodovibrionaceae bacterium A322]
MTALPSSLAQDILSGNRRALARGITLIESTRRDHRAQAEQLLAELLPHSGRSIRLGISGVPGVGKSTFIEAFGLSVIDQGRKVAVLAIDPSSRRTGGSILGDKTRMEHLSRNPSAFIRPSPSAGSLGGVARRTREVMLLCEAAGFDLVIIETVGVGQSETAVADMVDLFALLLLPSGGDELQGIKKGIVELADLVVVNKADGDMKMAARRAAAEYQSALRMLRSLNDAWQVPVLQVSALKNEGMDKVWQALLQHRDALGQDGLEQKRGDQAKAWMWHEIEEELLTAFREEPQVAAALRVLEDDVSHGRSSAAAAAKELLQRFFQR